MYTTNPSLKHALLTMPVSAPSQVSILDSSRRILEKFLSPWGFKQGKGI